MRRDSGFTLIELMVTVSVLAILVTVGIPSMVDFVRNNRRAAAVNHIVSDIQWGRSTALSQGVDVVLCHSTDGAGCSGESDPDWSEGWVLFIDDDQDGVQDATDGNGDFDAGEALVAVGDGATGLTMPSSSGRLTFKPGFRQVTGTGGTIAACVDGADNDRWIVVSGTGRPRLQHEPYGSVSC